MTELTGQGIPHHHVVIGPLKPDSEVRCHGRTIKKGRETSRYIRRLETCACLSHEFAREWIEITTDSFMCFATEVDDAEGAGGYMGKYLEKNFTIERRRGDLPARRYSTSRCWPGGKRIRLKITEEGGWNYIRRWGADWFPSNINLNPREEDMLERVGDNVTVAIALRGEKRKAMKGYKRMMKGVITA